MYEERKSSVVPGVVLWTRRQGAPLGAYVRVLPDACMDLMWTGGRLLVAGPDTTAHVAAVRAGEEYAAVRFPPGAAPSVLGVPAGELRDLPVPLAESWPQRRERELAERVAESAGRTAEREAMAAAYGPGTRDRDTAAGAGGCSARPRGTRDRGRNPHQRTPVASPLRGRLRLPGFIRSAPAFTPGVKRV